MNEKYQIMTKIMLIAGERSGDLLGSKIIKSFENEVKNDTVEFCGVGGNLMEKEGFKSIFDMKKISVMGLFEVLKNIFLILSCIKQTVEFIKKEQPDIVITIDSPDFSFRVMKAVKQFDIENKIKKIHLIAPSVWVHRKKRAEKIAKIYDLLLCILPFEPPYFEKYGLKTICVGHPIFDKNSTEYEFNKSDFYNKYNKNSDIISITAGSRKSELNILLPVLVETINTIAQKNNNLKFHFLATSDSKSIIDNYLKKSNCDFNYSIIDDIYEKHNSIKNSKIVIAKSGTNLLEIAGFQVPMIVIYKFNFLTNVIAKILQKLNNVKYVSLLNIINNKKTVEELLLFDCNSKNILNIYNKIIDNQEYLENQIEENLSAIKQLGYKDNYSSIDKIKNEIMQFLA